VAKFYANVSLFGDVLTSTVNGVLIEVDARALGMILEVPATEFDLNVREEDSFFFVVVLCLSPREEEEKEHLNSKL